jgi:hypothetical protein
VIVEWRDPRFRAQRVELWKTEPQRAGEEVVHKLEPPLPQFIVGRVKFKDTGKPAAGVVVRTRGSRTRTDRQGRFRLKTDWPPPPSAPHSGFPASAWVEVEPPPGSAYLGGLAYTTPGGRLPKQDGTLGPYQPREVEIALPRGVLVRGRVVEKASGKGVPGAQVSFHAPSVANNQARTGPDGAFALKTAAGTGHLVIKAAAANYVPITAVVNSRRLFSHAIVPLNIKGATEPKPVRIALCRGTVVKGKLMGPDGKPVHGAVLISRLMTRTEAVEGVQAVRVSANFELAGCDPDKSFPVIFFQEQQGWGAVVQVSGKQAGKPLVVRLQRCGAAKARYLGADGRPVAKRLTSMDVSLVLGPGDLAFWGGFIEHSNIRKDWHTDAQGRITWRDLVPGVPYRIHKRHFTVRPGEVLDLGDIK